MINEIKIDNISWAGGNISSYVLEKDNNPIFAPTMFLLNLAKEGYSLVTLKGYSSRLKIFFELILQNEMANAGLINWQSMTDNAMSGYLQNHLVSSRKLVESSVDSHISALNSFYSFAWEYGLLIEKPVFSSSYQPDQTLEKESTSKLNLYISEDVFLNELICAVKYKSSFVTAREELVLYLGYYAGLRSHEVNYEKNLRLDFLRKELPFDKESHVPKSLEIGIYGKSSRRSPSKKYRILIIPPILTEKIYKFIHGHAKEIKDGPLICQKDGSILKSVQHAGDTFGKCRMQLNVDNPSCLDWNNREFHTLRGCFATNLVAWCYDNGKDPWVVVPTYMGHTNRETTFNYVFFEAILNSRHERVEELSLTHSEWADKYMSTSDIIYGE